MTENKTVLMGQMKKNVVLMPNTTTTVYLNMAGLAVLSVVSLNASQSAGPVITSLIVKTVVMKEVFVEPLHATIPSALMDATLHLKGLFAPVLLAPK